MRQNCVTAAVTALAATSVVSGPVNGSEATKPNVVLIVSDDMGYGDTGPFGCKDIKTPNLDRLAAEGTVLSDAYVAGPICVPSRMGIFIGRYPQRWGIYGHQDGHVPKGQHATAKETVIAKLFKNAGYATALIGKWHIGGARSDVPVENRPDNNGFDVVSVIHGGMASYWPGTPLYIGNGTNQAAPEYLTDHFGKLSADFIARNKAKPFFLCLTFNAVHSPFEALESDEQEYAVVSKGRRTYAAMLSAMDRNIGRVLDSLKATGVEENTMVVFMNDNGAPPPMGGKYRCESSNRPLRGYKFDVLEGGVRTPMIMKWPGRIPAGKRFAGISSAMDLSATFLSAAGIPAPTDKPLDGVDLLPYLAGKKAGNPHETLFWECNWYKPSDCAVRRGNWKLVQQHVPVTGPVLGKWQLFDLSKDIGEANDVATKHPDIVKELDSAFRGWRSQMVDSCTKPVPSAGRGQ